MRKLAVLLLLLAFAVPTVAKAAQPTDLVVHNATDKCAWITVYWANNWTFPWEIVTGDGSGPGWLRPGETRHFRHHWKEAKVRAEVTRNADCSGGTMRDTYDVRKDFSADTTRHANLVFADNQYWLWFK